MAHIKGQFKTSNSESNFSEEQYQIYVWRVKTLRSNTWYRKVLNYLSKWKSRGMAEGNEKPIKNC